MKRVYPFALCAVLGVAALACFDPGVAQARKEYKDQFIKKYVTETPTTPAQKAMDEHVKAVNCGVCHQGAKGKDKKKRNAYGEALSKLITKEKDATKIDAALDEVAKAHSQADDAASPTYGDLLGEGKLPAPTP
jgi:hypothetical protein